MSLHFQVKNFLKFCEVKLVKNANVILQEELIAISTNKKFMVQFKNSYLVKKVSA